MSFFDLLLVFLKAAMLTSGGLQALPLLQDDLIAQRHLLTTSDFATAVAIGRISPGPNGFFVLSIGYYIMGIAGLLAAALGIMVPALFGIPLVRAHRALATRTWVAGMTRGIGAAAVGLLCALGYSFGTPLLAQPASFAIFVAALALLFMTRIDALIILAGGGVVAGGLYLLGIPLA